LNRAFLKINEKTAYKLVADGKIPGFKVGGSDNATGFRINPLSCTSPLGHPRLRCGLGFKRLGHEPSWRLSRRNFPIARLAPKDCEGNARHLVGERHGDDPLAARYPRQWRDERISCLDDAR
jgi:hypothetical protein